jgi:hypothetical protein
MTVKNTEINLNVYFDFDKVKYIKWNKESTK